LALIIVPGTPFTPHPCPLPERERELKELAGKIFKVQSPMVFSGTDSCLGAGKGMEKHAARDALGG